MDGSATPTDVALRVRPRQGPLRPGRRLEAILERDRARGEQPPTLERTTDALPAPLYHRAVFTDDPLTPEWTHTLVSHLLPD
ncbi:TetR-like C-terminal domain-containing protein [Embleya scabrispora]|uniref:TetR-like C-terminal domain-containing protein n=1 Tax=Embleya scabrispora TaxID=159449 RepID=UPI0019126510|nr:TetR-like C-terminal domain-containing protein [Embleya scabrispora]